MRRNLAFILFVFIFSGCEKVIDLDLEFTEKRIVVDAKINKNVKIKIITEFIKLSDIFWLLYLIIITLFGEISLLI